MISHGDYWRKICELHEIPYNNEIFLNLNTIKRPNSAIIKIDSTYQTGGVEPKKVFKEMIIKSETTDEKFIYNKKRIVFFKTVEDDVITYSIKKHNDDKLSECLLIQIELGVKIMTDKEHNNVAHISSVMNTDDCNYYKSFDKMSGNELFDIGLEFIKSKKALYNISLVYLMDNSKKICTGIKSKKMSRVYTILNGHTWYGNKGFRPFDVGNKNELYRLKEYYNRNVLINKLLKVKHVNNLQKMIKDGYIKYRSISNELNSSKLSDLLNDENFEKKYGNSNLGEFLKFLLENKLINCYIYFDFAEEIFEKIKIDISYDNITTEKIQYYDFYGKSFYLNI